MLIAYVANLAGPLSRVLIDYNVNFGVDGFHVFGSTKSTVTT